MDYNFEIGEGLGKINFESTKDYIFQTLGKPITVNKTVGNKCYTFDYDYDNLGIGIVFDYDEFAEPKNTLHIHTDNIVFNNKTWKGLNRNNLLKIIRTIHKKRKINYKYDYEKIEFEDFTQKEYNFDNIGLTLWLKNNLFDEAVVYKPEI